MAAGAEVLDAARDALVSPELHAGLVAGALVAMAARLPTARDRTATATAAAVVLAWIAASAQPASLVAVAVLATGALFDLAVEPVARRARVRAPVLAVAAMVAAYGCMPDTERSLAAAGAVAAFSAVRLVTTRGHDSRGIAVAAAAAVVAVAVVDAHRSSALVAGSAIAAAALLGSSDRAGRHPFVWTTAAVTIMGAVSRLVGLRDDATEFAVAATVAMAGIVVVVLLGLALVDQRRPATSDGRS